MLEIFRPRVFGQDPPTLVVGWPREEEVGMAVLRRALPEKGHQTSAVSMVVLEGGVASIGYLKFMLPEREREREKEISVRVGSPAAGGDYWT